MNARRAQERARHLEAARDLDGLNDLLSKVRARFCDSSEWARTGIAIVMAIDRVSAGGAFTAEVGHRPVSLEDMREALSRR